MNVFESELKKGRFVVGECPKCNKITWPPSNYCSTCFGDLSWRHVRETGILIEFSKKDGKTFAIVELEDGIRVIGTVSDSQSLAPGKAVRLTRCSLNNSPEFIFE
jgi:uncharacterized protein